jgi:hypothetical protein
MREWPPPGNLPCQAHPQKKDTTREIGKSHGTPRAVLAMGYQHISIAGSPPLAKAFPVYGEGRGLLDVAKTKRGILYTGGARRRHLSCS